MKKKIIAVMLVCGICMSFTACGGKKDINSDTMASNPANKTVMSQDTSGAKASESTESDTSGEAADGNSGDDSAEIAEKKAAAASKSVAVDGDENMMEFKSENGYSVIYPNHYEVVPESADIDFVVTDKASMSSVNISTIWEDSSVLFEVTKEGYQQLMLAQDMPVNTLDLYEVTQINGIDALRIQYTYNDTEFVQTFYKVNDKRTHCVTYSKTKTISDEAAKELEQITNTLTNTLSE